MAEYTKERRALLCISIIYLGHDNFIVSCAVNYEIGMQIVDEP